jgi:hypothetical protein
MRHVRNTPESHRIIQECGKVVVYLVEQDGISVGALAWNRGYRRNSRGGSRKANARGDSKRKGEAMRGSSRSYRRNSRGDSKGKGVAMRGVTPGK